MTLEDQLKVTREDLESVYAAIASMEALKNRLWREQARLLNAIEEGRDAEH